MLGNVGIFVNFRPVKTQTTLQFGVERLDGGQAVLSKRSESPSRDTDKSLKEKRVLSVEV